MITGVGPQSSLMVSALGDMRTRLTDLQRQLGTGEKSTTYAGLGIDRGLAVGLQSQLSAMSGYADTVTQIGVRMSLQQTSLARIADLSGAVKGATVTQFDIDTSVQTATAVATPNISMSSSIGIASGAWAVTCPPSWAAAAPIAIWMKPVAPDAVPATCGRMLTALAIDVGSNRPLPTPMTIWGRKIVAISQPGSAT